MPGWMCDLRSERLIVTIASSALVQAPPAAPSRGSRADGRHRERRLDHADDAVVAGPAVPLIRRLFEMNRRFGHGVPPVDVALLSRADPRSGPRLLRTLNAFGLPFSRAHFLHGRPPHRYARALGSSLFLSGNLKDVQLALRCGVPAGYMRPNALPDDRDDGELRVAFDFDGVLADDTAERLFQARGLEAFQQSEHRGSHEPLGAGPLARFCRALGHVQRALDRTGISRAVRPGIRTSIITSRAEPADRRVTTTLRHWGVSVDDTYFLGGRPKAPVLVALKPHIFFDDQWQHVESGVGAAPCAHVPYGVTNISGQRPGPSDRFHRSLARA